MPSEIFRFIQRVPYSYCTIGDHVYYSRFLDILEAARGEFFRHLDQSFAHWQKQGTIFPVIECHVRYKAPARYDELLAVELWVTVADRARLNFAYRILNQEQTLIIEGETFHVCTGLDDKPKRLPEELRVRLEEFMMR